MGRWPGDRGGRPRGSFTEETKKRYEMKRRFLERTHKIADRIFQAHEDLALGHLVTITTPEGEMRVYKKSPDGASLRWMLEHIWGQAPIKIDLNGQIDIMETLAPETQSELARAIGYVLPKRLRTNDPVDGTIVVAKQDARPALPDEPHQA